MNHLSIKPRRAFGRALIAASLWLAAGGAAQADSNAYTDDKSVDVPTAAYVYVNQTTTQIGNLLNANQARLTDIEVADATNGLFTVTMVRNTGVYGAGWFWYVGKTFAEVQSLVSSNNGRLIDIEPYSTSAGIRYAVIMVVNSGNTGRAWTYLSGVSAAQVNTHISNTGHRLIQLQPYVEGGVEKYAIITVANTGADNKAWQYFYNQTFAQVGSRLSAFTGRLTSLERRSNGNYDIVLVKNTGADSHYSLYYGGLTSTTTLINLANQYGSRILDIGTYLVNGQRRYDITMIDNASTENRRMRAVIGSSLNGANGLPNGQWGAYLRQVGVAGSLVDINGSRRFEPASAIKAVHNLAVMRSVQAGERLNATLTYYDYGTSNEPDVCPDPARENTSFDFTTSLDNGKDRMMARSDNRFTRAITLRYATDPNNRGSSGIAFMEKLAVNTVGMTNTFIDQDRIGCSYVNGLRNQTTLADLGKLYEGVENGTLLGTGAFRTEFYQPMNGQAFDGGGVAEPDIQALVQQEGVSLGKPQHKIDLFIKGMDWRFKPGGYGIGCDNPFTPCTSGFINIVSSAGRLTLPRNGSVTSAVYVFGVYYADRNVCDPKAPASSGSVSCTNAPSGFPTTTTQAAVVRAVDRELFRSIIRENLATF